MPGSVSPPANFVFTSSKELSFCDKCATEAVNHRDYSYIGETCNLGGSLLVAPPEPSVDLASSWPHCSRWSIVMELIRPENLRRVGPFTPCAFDLSDAYYPVG
jgi:hypothetical protein